MNRSNSNKASPITSKRGQTPNSQHSGAGGGGGGGTTFSGSNNLLANTFGNAQQNMHQNYQIFISPQAQTMKVTPTNNNGRRQQQDPANNPGGMELRQRIQNLLQQTDQIQQSTTAASQNTNLNKQQLNTYDGTTATKHQQRVSNNNNPNTISSGQRQVVHSPMLSTGGGTGVKVEEENTAANGSQRQHKRIILHNQNNSSGTQQQNPGVNVPLQRMLSEDSTSNPRQHAQNQVIDLQVSSSRIKLGFQENLLMNRRGGAVAHHYQSNPLPNHQAAKNGMTSSSNLLNKAALVTIMSSNQHITTSESSKFNSQVLALRSSLWLAANTPTTQLVLKSKRVQEIITSRMKCCQFCLKKGQHDVGGSILLHNDSSKMQQHTSHLYHVQHQNMMIYHDQLNQLIVSSLDKKYLTSQDYYNSKIVSDIMYNENRHIVSVFKDYLIFDDFSEYLKRYYREPESCERLPKVFEFYEKYSKVFPNYVALPGESKYMFKNIERKQKLIDEKHQQLLERQEKLKVDQEEAKALGVALDSSVIHRLRMSKNVIFGSQFINDLTDIQQHKDSADDSVQLLRKQSSQKIFDMLHTIQQNAPAYQHTPVINQFLRNANNNNFSRQHTLGEQASQQQPGNLEYLINQLHMFDNRADDSIQKSGGINMAGGVYIADISLTSSQGMSSFLQDFDLRENLGTDQPVTHKLPDGVFEMSSNNYRTQQQQQTHGNDDDFVFEDAKFIRGTSGGSRGSGNNHDQDKKSLYQQTQGTASRKSLQTNNASSINQKTSFKSTNGGTQSGRSKMASKKNSSQKASNNPSAAQTKTQWSNILLTQSKGHQQESVRKISQQQNVVLSSVQHYQKSNLTQQATQAILASKKQPTPKNSRGKGLLINPQAVNQPTSVTPTATTVGGISPPAAHQMLLIANANNSRPGTHHNGGVNKQQQQYQDNAQQYQTIQPGGQPGAQSQYQVSIGRSSQVSLGSPLSLHSVQGSIGGVPVLISPQPTSMMIFQQTQPASNKSSQVKSQINAQQLIAQMPPGSSLKQLATAAAKANMKKPSGRTMNSNASSTKPNIQITLPHQASQPPQNTLMPRSGGQIPQPSEFTPNSLNAAISAGLLLGSAGNSQSSMRVSPELGLSNIPPKKQNEVVSKSFKVVQSNQLVGGTITKSINPNSISQSIKDAVNKLIVPSQGKNQQLFASTQSNKNSNTSSQSNFVNNPQHGQQLMNNTAALFSKLFTTQQQNTQQHQMEVSPPPQHQPVYSTRGPQKKNFSSPDDLQVRIAARKNQHQQLVIATAQSTLQSTNNLMMVRKSVNDVYEPVSSQSPGTNLGKQKMMIVLKSKSNSKSPQQQSVKSLKLFGQHRGSTEEVDVISQPALQLEEMPEGDYGEEEDEMDERNDVYTAKGGHGLAVPVTVKSQSSLRGGIMVNEGGQRIQANSATAQSSVNSYNFKMSQQQQQHVINAMQSKRNPSNTSDKSHTSSMKSNYSGAQQQANNPYSRVLSSFSTGTKKKVKVALMENIVMTTTATVEHPQQVSSSIGTKLYEKIKSGMQAALGTQSSAAEPKSSTPITHKSTANNNNTNNTAVKKKPSTIFSFGQTHKNQ